MSNMEWVYKAEVECLRKVLAERDKEIKHLQELLEIYDREEQND